MPTNTFTRRKRASVKFVACLALLLTSGCATIFGSTQVLKTDCPGWLEIIYPIKSDSTETKRQVLLHNENIREFCQ